MTDKSIARHTPGPLFVKQPDTWPFNISTVNAAGEEIFYERRNAYGSDQNTVAEVMAGSCFSNPETRAAAVESNKRQLADAYLRAAAPELFAVCQILMQIVYTQNGNLHDDTNKALAMASAAIAKAAQC